jgi:head-tail adaptor
MADNFFEHPRLAAIYDALDADRSHLEVWAYRAWQEWNRAASYGVTEIDGIGAVESWYDVTKVNGSLVSFRSTTVFASDGEVLTSDSTLRFRGRAEVQADLFAHGYVVDDVRGAPDPPGREFVFFARRPG